MSSTTAACGLICLGETLELVVAALLVEIFSFFCCEIEFVEGYLEFLSELFRLKQQSYMQLSCLSTGKGSSIHKAGT